MPALTMTSGFELLGKAYKTRTLNINYLPADPDSKDAPEVVSSVKHKGFIRANSSFMKEDYPKTKRGNVVNCINNLQKDPSQTKYLEDAIRK